MVLSDAEGLIKSFNKEWNDLMSEYLSLKTENKRLREENSKLTNICNRAIIECRYNPNRNPYTGQYAPKEGESFNVSCIISLQHFAEKDISNQSNSELKKGIRSFEKQIALHKDKLNNPEKYVPDWKKVNRCKKDGLSKHWNKEIKNFEKSIKNRLDELKKRGEQDE